MTFNEWEKDNWMYVDVKDNARVIWDAAQLSERDACAKACEEVAESYRGSRYGKAAECIGDNCVESIRMRSNVEIT
jgi:hypothetical protein